MSYSHYGEDLMVLHLLDRLGRTDTATRGIYVDVGAFDPIVHSNTLLLYQHGWRGVNVEPNPLRIERFLRLRPKDVNLCAAVADHCREVVYLHYPTEGTNRIVERHEVERRNVAGEAPVREDVIKTASLAELLEPHVPVGTAIDFLDIDCEGQDMGVLRGFEWSRWTPAVVAVEAYDDDSRAEVRGFMQTRGYSPVAQNLLTLIFVKTATAISDLRVFA
jgi:FkbM family methyltransferase